MLSFTKSRLAGKTFLQTLFFFLLVTQISFAQWYQQNSGTSAKLNSVHFEDTNNGWAVGDSGTILRTTNGGSAWAIQASGTILPLNDIFFTDVNNGWAVGGFGVDWLSVIIHTTDAGTTWNTQLILPESWLTDIFFIDENIGWVVGWPKILKTTNGGSTWIDQSPPVIENWIDDVYFINANLGFIVGGSEGGDIYASDGVFLKTTNGGDDWSIIADSSIHWLGISFSDSLNGIVVGRDCALFTCVGSIFRTTDGGISWTLFRFSEDGWLPNSIEFADSNHSWIFGSNTSWTEGTIFFSSDKGLNWTSQIDSGLHFNFLNSGCFINSSTGWTVGDNGTILHTTNGGVTFIQEEQIDEIPSTYFLSNNFPNPFNPSTKIKYSVPQSSNVVIKVFDVLGNEIETLVNEEKPAGTYELNWNAGQLPSGVYFYQLKARDFISTKKMLLLK